MNQTHLTDGEERRRSTVKRNRPLRSAALVAALVATSIIQGAPVQAQDDAGPTGTLSVAYESDLFSLDPAIAYDSVSIPGVRLLYETLVTYDEGTGLVPALAESMPDISEDGLTYTFTLRDGVNFVRKGELVREVTADDVVASLNRLFRPDLLPYPSPVGGTLFATIAGADAVLAGEAESATGLEALDERTVRITLTAPDRTFLNVLAMSFGSVLPAETGLDGSVAFTDPVGTGPYFLDSYEVGEKAVFAASPHYWQQGMPRTEAIEIRLLVPADTSAQQALAGDVDITGDNVPPATYEQVRDDPAYADRVVVEDLLYTLYLGMDTSGEASPFQDPLVRRAVQHAIDKDNLLRIVNGRGQVAGCLFPPKLPGFDATCAPYAYDVEAAQALMDEAGVEGISTQLYTDTTEISTLQAESIAADLAHLGIEVEVITQDWDALLGTISTPHAAPLVLVGWYADYPDPSNFIDPILSCATAVEGGANATWFCDPSIDAEAAEARKVTDLEAVIPTYQDLQRRIMEQSPLVPLIYPAWSSLKSDRVTGLERYHPVWTLDYAAYALEG